MGVWGYSNFPEVYLEKPDDDIVDTPQLKHLKSKLKEIGIVCGHLGPGQTNHLLCPMCKGGKSSEKSLALLIAEDCNAAVWNCFRAKCGWAGSTRGSADVKSSYNRMNKITPKVKNIRRITAQELKLEPLCRDLLEYFAERMISEETLRRNSVMQRLYMNQIVIAFTYKRKGELINCKYRGLPKTFSQEADTEKILYGLDDIEGASDVIIVEGEMDKLAMEEAGFRNCVSVPDGAPPQVSSKDLPSQEQDIKYQYLWNCREYLEKASRIILATDGDAPGQALAEELSRRLGKERCWRVTWPSKNENERFKDANEVLMFMGPAVLREVIESAELYPIKGLLNFRDYFSEIDAYYHQTLGTELGISTGWKALDDLYNVC
ncbi:putative DNA helicase [Helianthus annuus]|nr:putative DNA helicase [Helianthus annuus]